ncbi:A disintegrin and metalloproteinase with thrombospondin motifs 7 [Megalopta genalis]|uniref:A disintegrin and metalloproteinase with thrombospondin motifs 7 n=1 Tax=Megalopta genalis TaxID=115081 RepID=UPI003FCF3097
MNGFQALLTFLGVLVLTDGDLIAKYRGARNVYHGRYTRDVHQPEFLIPKRVFEDGKFATYSLPNFYNRDELSRRKRSSGTDSGADKLHLVLPFNGIEHHVELDPHHEFISPDMVIETRGAGLRTNLNEAIRFKRAPDQQCHYRGFVRGHRGSKAALSLCDGVVGYVQTDRGRYFIEPANEAEPEPDGRHVHIAYERSVEHEAAEKDGHPPKKACGVSDNWEIAWAEALAEREKRSMKEKSLVAKRADNPYSATHSIHRYLTLAVVADRMFLDYHNNTNYEQYLMTVMNMVADFYHDASTGNQIDVILVRMIYLEKEKEEIDLRITPAAEGTLENFLKWVEKLKPADENHPNHFDAAVLVTRHDICSRGTNCNLLGLAYVGTVCAPNKAGAINEDTGLTLGITVAHELGHSLGCAHDEGGPNACPPQDSDQSYYVMSPYIFFFTIRWSPCSTKFMTELFSEGLGDCLSNNPRNPPENFKFPNMLPGAMYDSDYQCNMVLPGSKHCLASEGECERLWCTKEDKCVTQGTGVADGTKCGESKWCIHKKCVDMGTRPKAVHGGWGEWGPMSKCSRTCGGGLKTSERECNKPYPSSGGRYCIGERKKLAICNTQPCDPTKPPIRAVQCTLYNKVKVFADGILYTWRPHVDKDFPCALFCVNEKNVRTRVNPQANDTTPCRPGTNDMCIGGVCRKVSCDWILDGSAVEDKCGICKGDGTKCKKIEGVYDKQIGPKQRTFRFYRPRRCDDDSERGAQHRHNGDQAEEESPPVKMSRNETVISPTINFTPGSKETRYRFNDSFYCSRGFASGDYECADAMLVYTHPESEKEHISMKGPISDDLLLQYVFYGSDANENFEVTWSYYVSASNPGYTPKYLWDFTEWSSCDAKCGGGTMISEATCIEQNSGKVTPNFCESIPRPETKSRLCNVEACPARWRVSQWSRCNACNGKSGWKHRKVQCVKPASRAGEDDVQANFDACKGRVPKQKEECVGQRPCKKTCPKPSGDTAKAPEKRTRSTEKRAKMIDAVVDLNLARYLEKSYGIRSGADELSRIGDTDGYRQVLRDWSAAVGNKAKRNSCIPVKNLTYPKLGSIIKDDIPVESMMVVEAPYLDENLQQNLSDKAYQEAGDRVGVSIDTSREKVYHGEEAIKKIQEITGQNESAMPPSRSRFTYDRLARLVDPVDQR